MSDDGDSCNEPHQESYREKLASLSTELEQTESRLAAIQYLSEMIKKNTSFTSDEQYSVESQCRDLQERITTLKQIQKEQEQYIETTVKKCTIDLSERESILNKVFSDPLLSDHVDLMELFQGQHVHLQKMLDEVE